MDNLVVGFSEGVDTGSFVDESGGTFEGCIDGKLIIGDPVGMLVDSIVGLYNDGFIVGMGLLDGTDEGISNDNDGPDGEKDGTLLKTLSSR